MSQILIPDISKGGSESLLLQDLYFITKKTPLKTTVNEATCSICQKGLEDGMSVTAKRVDMKFRFFCQHHIPQD
jgi:hypothetical protein